MPYIDKHLRELIACGCHIPEKAGELNYAITRLIRNYWLDNGQNYNAINDVIGALESAKLEFYRRIAAPYEDTKIKENGDVY